MASAGAVSISLGGSARVYCVHNRPKRDVTELAFDPTATSIHLCACCENVFLERSDTPMFCPACNRAPTYRQQGPLPTPRGRI